MDILGSLAAMSFKAVSTTFIIMAAGYYLAKKNIVTREGNAVFGASLNSLFVPCMMFNSLAKGVSLNVLARLWPLVLLGTITPIFTSFIGYPLSRISKSPKWFERWYMVGLAFPNSVALPVILVAALCDQVSFPKTNVETGEEIFINGTIQMMSAAECADQGNLYIFIYIIMNALMFWAIGFNFLVPEKRITPETEILPNQSRNALENEVNTRSNQEGKKLSARVADFTPQEEYGTSIDFNGINNESIEKRDDLLLKENFPSENNQHVKEKERRSTKVPFEHQGSFMVGTVSMHQKQLNLLPTAEETRENGTITINDDGIAGKNQEEEENLLDKSCERIVSTLLQPPILSQIIGIIIGMILPIQTALYDPHSWLRPLTAAIQLIAGGAPALSNISMSVSLGHKLISSNMDTIFQGRDMHKNTIPMFILAKMVIVPIANYIILYLILDLLPNDRLLRLICFIEVITPTANMSIVLATVLKQPEVSEVLSAAVLGQYIIAFPCFIVALVIALSLTA